MGSCGGEKKYNVNIQCYSWYGGNMNEIGAKIDLPG
jgi:hypothetical protein